jgi:DNA-binding CsgD family transcriptional regulator
MVRSDARNKEVAIARIKRLASSGLPLEPFARTALDLLNDGVAYSPNRVILAGGSNYIDSYIGSTPEIATAIPLYRKFFLDAPPEVSGLRVPYDTQGLSKVLPSRIIWTLEQLALPDFYRREGFNAVYRPLGWHHLVQVIFQESGEFAGYCPVWRSADQKPFVTDDINFLRAAAPHIAHGLKTAQLMRRDGGDGKSFAPLAGWSLGTILMDGNGQPIAIDAQARMIFQSIGVLDGVNVSAFSMPQLRDAFDYIAQALDGIFRDPASGSSAAGPPVARVYAHWSGIMLQLRGLRMVGADGREYTTVLVERGETADSRRRRLAARWGLSQREAEVLNLIVESKTGPEISILLGISHETARKHSSSIFAKLGVETRATAAAVARDFA